MSEAVVEKNYFWTFFIGLLFVTAISSSIYFVVVAIQTNNGVVTASPYEDSLQYEKKKQLLETTQQKVGKLASSSSDLNVQFVIKNSVGEETKGLSLSYKALFPAKKAFDQEGTLIETDGSYTLPKPLPAVGIWLFEIQARDGDELYLWEKQVVVR